MRSIVANRMIIAFALAITGSGIGNSDDLRGLAGKGEFQPPTPPTEIEQAFPPMALADVEVDNFIKVGSARETFGVSGKKLAVAIVDSGINHHHKDFSGKVISGRNFTPQGDASDIIDNYGHGSNVAGIIAGRHVTAGGQHTGIAYDAKIVPLKVFYLDDNGQIQGGKFEWINDALQWVLDNQQQPDCVISVVNLSLGSQGLNLNALPNLDEPGLEVFKRQSELIKQLRQRNIVVTVSAGNDYNQFDPAQGMSFPAIIPETLSVGAIYDVNLPKLPDNRARRTYLNGGAVYFTVAGRCTVFSQRLSASAGGNNGTDVFSPGFFVTSAGPVVIGTNGQVDAVASHNTQTIQDGTSQASPVTAGVVLLLQERYLNLTSRFGTTEIRLPPVDLVERCIRDGGHQFMDVDDQSTEGMHSVGACGGQFCYLDSYSALSQLNAQFQNDLAALQSNVLEAKNPIDLESALKEATILTKPVFEDR